MQRTGASTVIHKVTWLHDVVYTSEGNPASYQDLTMPLFVQGYRIVMELEHVHPSSRLDVRDPMVRVGQGENISIGLAQSN